MKKMLLTAATAAGISAAIAAGGMYPTTCIITDVNEVSDVVTMSTCEGFEYQFEGIEDYFEGDLVSCIMFNNFTPDIADDVIISQQYTGTPKMFENVTQ